MTPAATPSLDERVRAEYLAQLDRAGSPVAIDELVRRAAPLVDAATAAATARRVEADVAGLGPLEALWDDPIVTDVLANGPGEVWIERAGRLQRSGVVVDRATLEAIVDRTFGRLGVRVDRAAPIADGRLPDGSRISVVLPPVAVDGPLVSIRRFTVRAVRLGDVAAAPVAALLRALVARGANLVVYGGTGSGKTTLLNSLGAELPRHERVVTVEDAAELQLGGDHVVRLEARAANAEGAGRVGLGDLVRAALRMRPDRIVVGEVRGPEAFDMVWAMGTGHDGSMSTVHASSAAEALLRLETFVSMAPVPLAPNTIRAQLAVAVDALVGVARTEGGSRRVVAVHEVCGSGDDLGVRALADATAMLATPARAPRRSA